MTAIAGQGALLVDAGNTRLKWLYVDASLLPHSSGKSVDESLGDPPCVEQQRAASYDVEETPQQGTLRILADLLVKHAPERVVLVHVLGQELTHLLRSLCQQRRCKLIHVSAQQHHYGIKSAYANPSHLGADRLVALVAARFFAKNRSAIIIDCGTAATIDAVTADGQHLGGVIFPGLHLMGDALIRRTQASHMAASSLENPTVFADNTMQGIGSGCSFSLVGAVEGICQRMQNQMSENPMRIICGGDASSAHALLLEKHRYRLEPAALMIGLWVIAGTN